MLALTLAWPKFFYPLVWISLAFIFEPVNRRLGRPHFLAWLQHGDWRPVISPVARGADLRVSSGDVEYWSWPQWVYHTPGAQFLHVFAMPLLGYGGYIPFALELFGLKNLLWHAGQSWSFEPGPPTAILIHRVRRPAG